MKTRTQDTERRTQEKFNTETPQGPSGLFSVIARSTEGIEGDVAIPRSLRSVIGSR